MQPHILRIAFDIGGVMGPTLEQRKLVRTDGVESYPVGPQFPGAMSGLATIANIHGPQNIFVISKATGEIRIQAVDAQLRCWDFFRVTRIPEENVMVYSGGRDQKATIAAKWGITHMVDDRVEVLVEMAPAIRLVAYNPDPTEHAAHADKLMGRDLKIVRSWSELVRHFGI